MANLSKTTRDHEEIRRWAEERGGKPAHVKRTGSKEDIGILRIDFPGFSGEKTLEPISWEQFFEKFDDRGLALVFQEETAGGQRSNFNKLISGETAAQSGRGGSGRSRGSRKRAGGGGTSRSRKSVKKAGKAAKKAGSAKKRPPTKSASKKTTKKASKKSASAGAARKKSSGSRSTTKRR